MIRPAMRASENFLRPEPAANAGSIPDRPDPGAQSGTDGIDRSFAALESAFVAVRERVERLESEVRDLQGQSVNRS